MQTGDQAALGSSIPEIINRILAGRGMMPEAMADFLYPDYERDAHDPFLLTDMAAAVERIRVAAERKEAVVVYGDYDIDGITASAVLLEGLAALGIPATSYIPDRFEEGYGINQAALEKLLAAGTALVISVDCGITSLSEAGWAREHGLDLVITDHHAVPPQLPEAVAVVNPKRVGDQYPWKDLAGVGVAFKLVQALQQRLGRPKPGQEKWLLDLVALGTVCDVVTLLGENRMLASYGLKVMRQTRRVGLRALAAVGGVDISRITAHELGFVLGPRMNAAGRLEHAAASLELVTTGDTARAAEIATMLDELNQRRRDDQARIFEAANAQAEAYLDDPVLVLAAADWSHGVVGIVASKLVEKWQKPVLVAQIMGETAKGSARSVPGFNMVEALRAHSELFTKFGGHFFAAGYTLPLANLDELRQSLVRYHAASAVQAEASVWRADVSLADLADVGWPLLGHLELLEPHGSGNDRPLFEAKDMVLEQVTKIGRDAKHLRLNFRDRQGARLGAIGFGLSERYPALTRGQKLTVLGELNKNEFQGNSSIQMVVRELRYE